MENNYTYLKLLQSKDISFWDVIRLSFSQERLSNKFPLVKLESVISPRKEKIKKAEYKGKEPIVSKISFNDGKLHLRDDRTTGMDLYKLYKDDLLVSNINFHQGAVAINNLETLVCSTHYQPYIVDYSKIDPMYLILVLRNKVFLDYILNQKTNGIKTEAHYNFIKELEIPLPSVEKQKELVRKYEETLKIAIQKAEESDKLEKSIDDYIFSKLFIKKIKDSQNDNLLFKTVVYNKLKSWDIKNISNIQTFLQSSIYDNYSMTDVLSINPKTLIPANIKISFIPMEYIDEIHGEVQKMDEKNSSESKGYTKFMNNDIIWAKITPCMQNGKSALVGDLQNEYGCGSTEFYVIRNDKRPNLIRCKYIYYLLRLKTVLLMAQRTFTGACGQQRVPVSFLSELQIPLPPLKVQDEIIHYLDENKNKIKALRLEEESFKQQALYNFEQEVFN